MIVTIEKHNDFFSFIKTASLLLFFSVAISSWAQTEQLPKPQPTLGLEDGTRNYPDEIFTLELVNASQTAFALRNSKEDRFDYTPGERIEERSANHFYHLGDINLAVKVGDSPEWTKYSTAANRQKVTLLPETKAGILSASDLNTTLPSDFPLQLSRFWETRDGQIILKFRIDNPGKYPVEIGALGIPMIFNNNLGGKSLDEAHASNVFFDPYIGKDAGYLQVVRLHGRGNVLLVLPLENSGFEAYRPLLDDPTRRGITFEGFHEWMIHSKAYAENEWTGAEQWNTPTSKVLAPGESYEVGVRFALAEEIRNIESTLIANERPVAQAVPGFVLPQDVEGQLFLKHSTDVEEIVVTPAGSLEITAKGATAEGWKKYQVQAKAWGRSVITVKYADGKTQTIHYKLIKPESEVIAANGKFLTTEQWYENNEDLFGRSPSVITYDYEKHEKVIDDARSWIAGLSDEGGAGAWLNAVMKQLVQPDPSEVAKLERFVNETVWGGLQYNEGDEAYGVRKSMYYYAPEEMPEGTYSKDLDYSSWTAWSKEAAMSVERSYNYPHVAAAHWVMYRLAKNYKGLVQQQTWDWYLEKAALTAQAMVDLAPYYAQFGQMEGSVFLLILQDLKKEGFFELATKLEATMKKRADHWASLNYPFGSEMPWDSTGQEEVYEWSKYFGFSEKALVTLNAILAYMPTMPHWAYNGNARRYWDFQYGGKIRRIERMIHHYGSSLNAIPVLHEYRQNPDDFYLLRVGYGGLLGGIANINEEGFAPCAFHSYPEVLANDGISGDYGSGYYGYAVNTATYLYNHEDFGWLAFGGNVRKEGGMIAAKLTTADKKRVYIAEADLWISLAAGQIDEVKYQSANGSVTLIIGAKKKFEKESVLTLTNGADEKTAYQVKGAKANENGDYEFKLKGKQLLIILEKTEK